MSTISAVLDTVNDQMESSSCHMTKTKAYKMYLDANRDTHGVQDIHDVSKLDYLQWTVQQIEDGVLDGRHLIVTKGLGRTLVKFYANKVVKEALIGYIQVQREAVRLAEEKLNKETLHASTSAADPVTAAAVTPPEDVVAEAVAPIEDAVAEAVAPIEDTVAEAVAPIEDTVAEAVAPIEDTVAEAVAPIEDTGAKAIASIGDTGAKAIAPIGDTGAEAVALIEDTDAKAVAQSEIGDGKPDTFKLRFVKREDWVGMGEETRNFLDSLENNKTKGQLMVLDMLPTQMERSNVLSQHLFITSLARHTTASQSVYVHVAAHGTLVMSKPVLGKHVGLFRIQHGEITSKLCINSATCTNDPTHTICHCTFPV